MGKRRMESDCLMSPELSFGMMKICNQTVVVVQNTGNTLTAIKLYYKIVNFMLCEFQLKKYLFAVIFPVLGVFQQGDLSKYQVYWNQKQHFVFLTAEYLSYFNKLVYTDIFQVRERTHRILGWSDFGRLFRKSDFDSGIAAARVMANISECVP